MWTELRHTTMEHGMGVTCYLTACAEQQHTSVGVVSGVAASWLIASCIMHVRVRELIWVVSVCCHCSTAQSWSWSTSTSGTKPRDTPEGAPGATGSPVPLTAPTAACTEPGRCRHWARRRRPRRSASTGTETATSRGSCMPSPRRGLGPWRRSSLTSPDLCQTMWTCPKECEPYILSMGQPRSPAWTTWWKVSGAPISGF